MRWKWLEQNCQQHFSATANEVQQPIRTRKPSYAVIIRNMLRSCRSSGTAKVPNK